MENENIVLPEPTPSGVCGWCHIAISDNLAYYRIHGNMCEKCSARVGRSLNGLSREEVDKDLTQNFGYVHFAGLCVKPDCNKKS
jgi:hypothetical protein